MSPRGACCCGAGAMVKEAASMKKRTCKWIGWGFLLLLIFAVGFGYGFLTSEVKLGSYGVARSVFDWSRQQPFLRRTFYRLRGRLPDPDHLRGAWHPLGDPDTCSSTGEGRVKIQDQMKAVGYLSGYKPADDRKGVTLYIPELTYNGVNLITSGHGQEAILADMKGTVVHRWTYEFEEAFPDFRRTMLRHMMNPSVRDFWRRSYVYPNGDLLAVYDGFGIVKLDKDSNLIWAVPGGCHHDLFVDETGLIYTLMREQKELPQYDESRPVLEDLVGLVDQSGNVIRKVSVLKAFEQSSYASFLANRPHTPDILHTNAIEAFDGTHAHRSPVFKQGNILISPRNINVIAIMDMDAEKIVWALSGQWAAQHEPALLPNGNILVFDNQGHQGMSKVIEIDPFTQEIVWAYKGTPENGFYTKSNGAAHRLPNGNTLIIESNSGRAFEVTQENRLVWEYYNPERAGEDRELIATLFDVVRLGSDFPLDWLPQDE
jgi:hypothetical protein